MHALNDRSNFDVIIIGGGITGLGTARDCALRGLKVLLVERSDIATGASGRNHGLLHSGARYAVKDSESAAECIRENIILKAIAPHCIEDTQGLFITLREDEDSGYGLDYQQAFVNSCQSGGIDAQIIDPREAFRMERLLNPDTIGVVKVPDASVDPFKLCAANMFDARIHGAAILTRTAVVGLIREGDAIVGIETADTRTSEKKRWYAPVTVNAAGIYGGMIATMAGVDVKLYPAKGSLLVFGHRISNLVINRCRKSADGDILVPGDTVSVLGTTSTKVPFEECDSLEVTRAEVDLLLKEGCALVPSLSQTRILRAYAGVRPLVAADSDPSGRSLSRGIVCMDHETRDSLRGFVTITGGKLTTYRLMGQMATDAVCRKLGVSRSCTTDRRMLRDPLIPRHSRKDAEYVCDCERVTEKDIDMAVKELGASSPDDLRRRTRAGMGTCQGTYCTRRIAKALSARIPGSDPKDIESDYLLERWKGMCPVGWGDTIREMEFMQRVYKAGAPSSMGK